MTENFKRMGCVVVATAVFQFCLISNADDAIAGPPIPDSILKAKATEPAVKEPAATSLSDEDAAHVARVKRLLELKMQPSEVIQEPAGAEPARTSVVAETSTANDAQERLIEAIEQLQMEIRELRHDISKREAAAAEATVNDGPQGPDSLETYQPKASFRR